MNHAASALTAYTYEVRYTTSTGQELKDTRSEDYAGSSQMAAAVPGDLSLTLPENLTPIPARGRRTFRVDLRGASSGHDEDVVTATAELVAALFADGSSTGDAAVIRQLKEDRVQRVERLGLSIAALRAAERAGERSEVLAVLASEADSRPAVRDELHGLRAQLQAMSGDIHKNLRDLIGILQGQRNGVARGQ